VAVVAVAVGSVVVVRVWIVGKCDRVNSGGKVAARV